MITIFFINYQLYIILLTQLKFPAILGYKTLSIIFDYALAFIIGHITANLHQKNQTFYFLSGYSLTLFLPTVILNSAYWGQADAIYAFFAITAIFYLIKGNYTLAFICLGLALALKLQALFILPIFGLIYIMRKEFSFLYFALIPLILYLTAVPALFMGRDFSAPFIIYQKQAGSYHFLSSGFNFWAIIGGENYFQLHSFAVLFTLTLITLGLGYIWSTYPKTLTPELIITMTVWCVWTCVMFFPSMHERYGFIAEVLIIPLITKNKYMFIPLTLMLIPVLMGYSTFLFNTGMHNNMYIALLYLFGYFIFSALLFSQCKLSE